MTIIRMVEGQEREKCSERNRERERVNIYVGNLRIKTAWPILC